MKTDTCLPASTMTNTWPPGSTFTPEEIILKHIPDIIQFYT